MEENNNRPKWVQKYIEKQAEKYAVIESPEYRALREEIDKLQVELSMAILERDDLMFHQCKNIEAQYLLKFGELEYQVYELECRMRRTKRKLEMVIAKRNRQERINIAEIEEQLDAEFEAYKKQLNNMLGQMSEALKWREGEALSDEETKEIKALYRQIVKALHPDIQSENSDEQNELFLRAVIAYENADLEALRIIAGLIGTSGEQDDYSSLEKLEERISSLKKRLAEIQKAIERAKETYPYILKEFLEDDEKAEMKLKELTELKQAYEKQISHYEAELQKYLS